MQSNLKTFDHNPQTLNLVKNDSDAFIETFKNGLPENISATFTEEQLQAIKNTFEKKEWNAHSMDVRTSIGFWRWRFYFVLIGGRDRRMLSERHYKFLQATVVTFILFYLLSSTLLGILALYLLKSALGYDLIPEFSFGIWAWFKDLACGG